MHNSTIASAPISQVYSEYIQSVCASVYYNEDNSNDSKLSSLNVTIDETKADDCFIGLDTFNYLENVFIHENMYSISLNELKTKFLF